MSTLPPAPNSPPDWTWTSVPEPRRETPNMGDVGIFALVLVVTAVITTILGVGAALAFARFRGFSLTALTKSQLIAIGIPAQAGWYVLAILALVVVFRMVWNEPFSVGLHWNWATARKHWLLLVVGGCVFSVVVQAAASRLHMPKDAPIQELFKQTWVAWMVLVFGTLLAPAAEEICFRGFLLPALRRPIGVVLSAAITSALFALMHASQLAHAWGLVGVLFCVSLMLCYVRLKLNSVAASTLFHASYNGIIFVLAVIATHGFTQLDKMNL